jgi:hypothetical protein
MFTEFPRIELIGSPDRRKEIFSAISRIETSGIEAREQPLTPLGGMRVDSDGGIMEVVKGEERRGCAHSDYLQHQP